MKKASKFQSFFFNLIWFRLIAAENLIFQNIQFTSKTNGDMKDLQSERKRKTLYFHGN